MNHKLLLDTAVLAGEIMLQRCGDLSRGRYDVSYFEDLKGGVD